MHIDSLDHLVLTVRDLEITCHWYARTLGMEVVTFRNGRYALQFGTQKINLHQYGSEFQPKAHLPTPGSADLCFITSVPMEQVVAHLNAHSVEIIEGPVERTGAVGRLLSVYIRDPDENLIEIANQM
jgi:catechol 2,3-dioxygenase-like lactoylglutathione lyase family enzyme